MATDELGSIDDQIIETRLELGRLFRERHEATGRWPVESAGVIPDSLLESARLFSSRERLLELLPRGIAAMEVGTWKGGFAKRIWTVTAPRELHIVDLSFDFFDHDYFGGEIGSRVQLHQGDSRQLLADLEIELDFVYVDGNHSYEYASSDIRNGLRLLRPGGVLGINDYTSWATSFAMPFGVMRAANEAIRDHGLQVLYFALDGYGNHDIWVRKPKALDG